MTRIDRKQRRAKSSGTPGASERAVGKRREMRHEALLSVLRAGSVLLVLSLLYAFAPFDEKLHTGVVAQLVVMFLVLVAVTAWEFRRVVRSAYPEFRAIEAIAVTLPLLLLPYSAVYFLMSREITSSFNAHLSRLDALYFTITTFSTVGYGDIVARSEAARAVVTSQIVLDLLLIGLIGRALFSTAQRRRETLRSSGHPDQPGAERHEPVSDSKDG